MYSIRRAQRHQNLRKSRCNLSARIIPASEAAFPLCLSPACENFTSADVAAGNYVQINAVASVIDIYLGREEV